MKTIARAILVALLVCGPGCARPDWIQQTLVTVDVTGTWRSTEGSLVDLVLEQEGAKAKGSYRIAFTIGTATISSGTIEGTVAGDVLRFSQVGREIYGSFRGEMTVSGDELSGELIGPQFFGGRKKTSLRRIN